MSETYFDRLQYIQERAQQEGDYYWDRPCCPLSFCQSLQHTSIAECNHPQKYSFVGTFHTVLSRLCYEESHSFGLGRLKEFIMELKNTYFTEDHCTEEHLDILLSRFHINNLFHSSRNEKTNKLLREYAKMTKQYHHGPDYDDNTWGEEEDNSENRNRDIDAIFMEIDTTEENTDTNMDTDEEIDMEEQVRRVRIGAVIELLLDDENNNNNNNTEKGYLTDAQNNLLECPVCYETECFITTNCAHAFCECLVQHIMTKIQDEKTRPFCPCCREPITALKISNRKHYKIMSSMRAFPILLYPN